ncbi:MULTISPECIES: glycoside hydrolase family 88 protein [unclassified Bradyrhizobium]|uniref:glycoside hydrolase family 88 protein n=1 Tax=unclassified Bradyrhizobium TaxID=2631580 RepID=UPI001FFBBC29|nr:MULTISPECIES: glycoside hydrolase family 88 protein [unclassified Bradyrhizobium]MCK1299323.1 glycoside hydrolase family 88 protein [Bradyrhizobium sp. 37]MCK1772837.1 glycoside hydrolase family 88 protein [Bradyrhizobium sp. 134]
MTRNWDEAIERIKDRIRSTAQQVGDGFPHWADPNTGIWKTTAHGDWTGGYWLGMLWLASRDEEGERCKHLADEVCKRLVSRVNADTAFKAATFYYGAGLGALLGGSKSARELGLAAARDIKHRFDPKLGLVPLGANAEEGSHVGATASSIDSLVVSLLLFWAARESNDSQMLDVAAKHTARVLSIHQREDGAFVQSSSLDVQSGEVLQRYTHKGYSESSVWARAQAWGVLGATISCLSGGIDERFLAAAVKGADWWIDHVPADGISYWDFNDPAAPNTERDTAASAFMASTLFKLSSVAPCEGKRQKYKDAAEKTAAALVDGYLTPLGDDDKRPVGMLVEGCFNKREDSRPEDYVKNAELIFGSYYLFEALLMLSGRLQPSEV